MVWTVDGRNVKARRFYEGIGARYVEGLQLMVLDVEPFSRPDEGNPVDTAPDLGRVHLRVARPTDDLAAVLRFYRDGLGFDVLDEFRDHDGFDGVMVGRRGAAYHLEFTRKSGPSPGGPPSDDDLLVFYLPDEIAWSAAVSRMEKAGYPDGYRVVLQNAAW
jgi:catechol 2,3-dioxygenase-like lactoylglutathione lyase family enzyme